MIVILENFAHVLEKVIARTRVRHVVTTRNRRPADRAPWLAGELRGQTGQEAGAAVALEKAVTFRDGAPAGARGRMRNGSHIGPADIALLQYTGGTTGTSKGAILTHGNLVANVLQGAEWSRPKLDEGNEIVVTALPLYHIFSLMVNCLMFLKLGGLNLLITNPRDMPGFVKELKKSRFTCITGVNTLFNGLLNTPGFAEVDFSSLKVALGGGAAIHRVVAERWREVTGHRLIEGYGLTEASPLVACNQLDMEFSGTIGLPMPSTEVVILDDQDCELPLAPSARSACAARR